MSDVDVILKQVRSLNASVKPTDAQELLESLMTSMGTAELRVWEPDLRNVINVFHPKRRRALTSVLEQLLSDQSEPLDSPDEVLTEEESSAELEAVISELADDLADLSNNHIFQWSTFYRDYLEPFYGSFIRSGSDAAIAAAAESVRRLFAHHSREIFTKGYFFVTRHDSERHAVSKSISGLQRFLDLPIEFYSAQLSTDLRRSEGVRVRCLTSALLCGILEGYSRLQLAEMSGQQILLQHVDWWAHALAFMTADHARCALDLLAVGETRQGLSGSIIPLASALDMLAQEATDYVPLPAIAQLLWPQRRLNVSLRPPSYAADRGPVEVVCIFDPDFVDAGLLSETSQREIGAIVAPLRPELRIFVGEEDRTGGSIVPVLDDETGVSSTSARLVPVLERAIYRRRSSRVGTQPLQYNFAKEFPLSNPFLTRYYHVYRTSVRDLLRAFERRNGVRLWCSVRRSGKTVAGIDFGTTTGQSNVISQTCDDTGQIPGGAILYQLICEALESGAQIKSDFLRQAVDVCSPGRPGQDRRTVLVLDEYETLFGRLATAVEDRRQLRYTVVQPLLNQMVAFTQDNLIVFLGQQPTAHYILMDQNQLSAYVQQDAFPLFSHDPSGGEEEFSELLRKILARRNVHFDQSFADRVFVETSGHPYLTVNFMVDFVDWLIKEKRPVNSLSFNASDISTFASRMLRRDRLAVSPSYSYFRDAVVREALSSKGRTANPWLYAIYHVIRNIALESPDSFSCSRSDFSAIVQKLRLEELGLTAEYLLTTGSQANFITFTNRWVAPRVRLLGRIAAVASPAVHP